ncbi:glycosyl hydrolase [Streptomyces sp. ME03-5684b]|uniref:glycosyl hydrolase n=1 Tax=Streptomyces sp. ME03-5684b TaxID=3028681 RepID=UPI0029AC3D51|nr:glycosyl hydrolase [Streptomyces sp. ME03-5684b]MDX3322940.1 glycosyl hydrolase [Streptomyces sp. ME03-5684b]
MRRRTSFLLALLLVVAGVTGTTYAVRSQGSGGVDASGSPVAAAVDHTVTFQNRSDNRIWVGSTVNADGSAALTGLPMLEPGQSATITIPEHQGAGHWRGKFFARQGCGGEVGSTFHCDVGDCGPYADHCSTGEQPTSLAEFNFDPADSSAPWYNVSYVNAVSTAVTISPDNAAPPADGECSAVGCAKDLLSACPPDNLVKAEGSGRPLVCVNPNRDTKTPYSDALNRECPTAYAWSKQDAEPGNTVVRQCTKCTGLTVAFHGGGPVPPDAPETRGPDKAPTGDNTQSRVTGNTQSRVANTSAKGVGATPGEGVTQALKNSGASWYYNWSSTTGPITKPNDIEYVPMIWGADAVTDTALGQAAKEGKALLGFNEPDLPAQANLTPEQALDLWPRLQSTGLRLGAPAVASGGDVAGGWLDRFMRGASERGLRVDFIPLHWFGGDFGPDAANQLRRYVQAVHDRYQKPIWLTEYGLIDYTQGTPRYPSEQQQVDFIRASSTMLDGLGFVERHAWFALSTATSPTGLYDGESANASGRVYREAG